MTDHQPQPAHDPEPDYIDDWHDRWLERRQYQGQPSSRGDGFKAAQGINDRINERGAK